ncbi:MAG: hypothetical protein RL685_3376 [Pseudomonadota bacterium]
MTRGKLLGLLAALGAAAGIAWWLLGEPAHPPTTPRPSPPLQPPASAGEAISRLRREVEELRQGGKSSVDYRAPTADELNDFRSWVDGRLRSLTDSAAGEVAAPAGFRLLDLGSIGPLLAEERHQRRGAGVLALRAGATQPWVIEVPHSFFDEGTLEVGLNAFVLTNARALLVNTVHRYRSRASAPADGADTSDDDDDSVSSDVAHAESSFFLTAHTALVDSLGDVGVVQLHGYGDASAPKADVVISAAGSRADPVPAAKALERALGLRVAVYPKQIRKLGGTKNVQARYSISVGRPFLHVEMSRSLRKELTAEPERLRAFIGALFSGEL